jgi:RNA polymerase sigma factor for flagellar operon FliA
MAKSPKSFLLDAQSNRLMLSLDDEKEKTTDNSDGGNRIIDSIADQDAVDLSADAEQLDYMSHLLNSLTSQERAVLVLYYFEGMSMKDVAKEAGLSESRICQIHGKALKYLLHKFSQYA